ncbi:MAG: amidase [Pseudomonadota bacterium]|nr:amidase [Pseudomonadota bacterium]
MNDNLTTPQPLGGLQTAEAIRSGTTTAREQALRLLARVDTVEASVGAWTTLIPEHLLAQADAADAQQLAGDAHGMLHGVAVGLKDVIDTADLPTENGTVLYAGRLPSIDAELVRRLRAAGGLVMGKTVTTEMATYTPGKTRNPHNPAHTPGGSSSGSAAAVAAGMVPLAVGTQTGGSVIRPAAFCGVVGYKPSYGWISRTGVLQQSPSLDQVGVFARNVDDAALLAQALVGHDPGDSATRSMAAPALLQTARSAPPLEPRLAFIRTPHWSRMDADAQQGFQSLVAALAGHVVQRDLPEITVGFVDLHRLLMEAEIAACYDAEYQHGAARLSPSLRSQIERGRAVSYGDHRRASQRFGVIRAALDSLFDDHDAILTPATLGTAPADLTTTGDSVMCVLWTAIGLPAITLPLLKGANGLPIGVQLVGRRDDDARLLRTANWLMQTVAVGAISR